MTGSKNKKNSRSGFSILELVIAIFVLTVGIVGALNLIVSTVRTSMDTRNAVIASGLAQEGVELLRNIRDNNMLYALADLSRNPDTEFKRFGTLPNGSALNCSIDVSYVYPNTNPMSCLSNFLLYLDASNNTYYHNSGAGRTATIYRRGIEISYDNSEPVNGNLNQLTGMNVVSRVWWSGNAGMPTSANCNLGQKCIEIKDYLPKRD